MNMNPVFAPSDTVSDEGLTDVVVCWSMTVHIEVDTPSERVSTSARHVTAQEFRQCRETFSTTNMSFLCPDNAPFNCHHFFLGVYFLFLT